MSSQYICIQSQGELDSMAITLLGASVKNEGAIGFFGSGLNYALAYFLRNGIDFKIFSGMKEIKITVKNEVFRGQNFGRIIVDDTPTSLTTDTGPKWTSSGAFREIWCNALDEGEATKEIVDKIEGGLTNTTRFYLKLTPDMREILDHWNLYFSNDLKIIETVGNIQVLERKSRINTIGQQDTVMYYRGVACGEVLNAYYSYNFLNIDIDESRNASKYDMEEKIGEAIATSENPEFIRNILRQQKSVELVELGYARKFGSCFASIIKEFDHKICTHETVRFVPRDIVINCLVLPERTARILISNFGINYAFSKIKGIVKEEVDFALCDQVNIDKALEVLKLAGYSRDVKIQGCTFISNTVHALADNETNTIYLNIVSLKEKTEMKLVSMLLEELTHLNTGYKDLTRELQTWLFDELAERILEE